MTEPRHKAEFMLVKCPYCQKELLKFPTRKTRCSYCDNFIYIRTRLLDRQRILVNKEMEQGNQKITIAIK